MAVMVQVEGKIKVDAVGRFQASLPGIFPDTRAYDGCRGVTGYLSSDDGQTFQFVEFWDTKPHYERYLAWRTETGAVAQLVSLLEADPTIRYFQQIDD